MVVTVAPAAVSQSPPRCQRTATWQCDQDCHRSPHSGPTCLNEGRAFIHRPAYVLQSFDLRVSAELRRRGINCKEHGEQRRPGGVRRVGVPGQRAAVRKCCKSKHGWQFNGTGQPPPVSVYAMTWQSALSGCGPLVGGSIPSRTVLLLTTPVTGSTFEIQKISGFAPSVSSAVGCTCRGVTAAASPHSSNMRKDKSLGMANRALNLGLRRHGGPGGGRMTGRAGARPARRRGACRAPADALRSGRRQHPARAACG